VLLRAVFSACSVVVDLQPRLPRSQPSYTKPRVHKSWRPNFREAPNICGSSVRNFLRFTLLAHRISRWLLDFWKICASLYQTLPPPPSHSSVLVFWQACSVCRTQGLQTKTKQKAGIAHRKQKYCIDWCILHEISKRKTNWIGHILCRNCLLRQVIEGKIRGG